MQYAFSGKDCVFASRSPGTVELECFGKVQTIARDEMLASDVDAVYICTPTMIHSDTVEAAINNRKHVLVEKTPTQSPKYFFFLRELAWEQNCKLEVVFQPRFLPWFFGCPRSSSGEISIHLPLGGLHENPIWDVAFYPIMTMGYLAQGEIEEIAFAKFGSSYRAVILFVNSSWILNWSVSAPFLQEINCKGRVYDKCFTGAAGDSIYRNVVEEFEEGHLLGVNRPIDVLQQVFPIFIEWQNYYENDVD